MTIAVLNYNTGDVDIIENCPNLRTNEEVENYLVEVLEYNSDEIHFMFSPDIDVNYIEPDDFGKDSEMEDRYKLIAKIHEEYEDYESTVGVSPKYVSCLIKFDNEENGQDVIIKLTSDTDEKDDEIFFYCDGLDDLVRLCYVDTEDFDLIEIYEFMNEI